jgi:hypothetical protein
MSIKFAAVVLSLIIAAMPIIAAADKSPIGPELAPKEIGLLLKGYPMVLQQNPQAIGGVGVLMWGCDYQVGKAMITITVATHPGDPMPCKRKVSFGDST